jgi:transposase
MSGKIVSMSKVKQVLQLHAGGMSERQIAHSLSLNRRTVHSYLSKSRSSNLSASSAQKLEDPELEHHLVAGTAAYTDHRFDHFKEQLPYLEKELTRKHVTRYLLWQEYLSQYPDGYRYSQFCYHLSQQSVARHLSAILTHAAGEKLFVDFAGDTLEYIEMQTGEVIKVQVFIACLPYSDYTFCMAVKTQTTEDFLYALSCCLTHLGGIPQILVPDNLKAAVVKTDRYEPQLNRLLEDFSNHYGFAVIPARAYRPKDKATVENHVKIIYSRVYAKLRNHRFFSLQELNTALQEKTTEHNQTRMQRTNYSRQEKFLADEKHRLGTLPSSAFEIKYYADLRVGENNCVYLARDKHHYSVPYTCIGERAQVIYTRGLVKIFCKGKQVATHQRVIGFGYSIVDDHLCSAHRHYNKRNPNYYVEAAKKRSPVLAEVIGRIFNTSRPPETLYKTCQGLLSLARKSESKRLEQACQIALDSGMLSYRFIKSLIESNALTQEEQEYRMIPVVQENIRGKEYYQSIELTKSRIINQ